MRPGYEICLVHRRQQSLAHKCLIPDIDDPCLLNLCVCDELSLTPDQPVERPVIYYMYAFIYIRMLLLHKSSAE